LSPPLDAGPAPSLLVVPVRRHPRLCRVVHGLRADLDLQGVPALVLHHHVDGLVPAGEQPGTPEHRRLSATAQTLKAEQERVQGRCQPQQGRWGLPEVLNLLGGPGEKGVPIALGVPDVILEVRRLLLGPHAAHHLQGLGSSCALPWTISGCRAGQTPPPALAPCCTTGHSKHGRKGTP